MWKFWHFLRGTTERLDERLYADNVREEGIKLGLRDADLEAHVEESVELRRILIELHKPS